MGFFKTAGWIVGGIAGGAAAIIAAPVILSAAAVAGTAALATGVAAAGAAAAGVSTAGAVVAGAAAAGLSTAGAVGATVASLSAVEAVGAVGAATVFGGGGALLGGAAKSVNEDYEAELNSINRKTQDLINKTEKSYEKTKSQVQVELGNLADLRRRIFNGSLQHFALNFRKLQNLDLVSQSGIKMDIIREMKEFSLTFNNNSTGSDVEFSYGEIRGSGVVLGALFGGAYLVGSAIKGVKLLGEIDKAKDNYIKVRAEVETVKTMEGSLQRIIKRSHEISEVITALDARLSLAASEMERNIMEWGADFAQHPSEVRSQIKMTTEFAQVLKIVIDTPVITEKGKLEKRSKLAINKAAVVLAGLN